MRVVLGQLSRLPYSLISFVPMLCYVAAKAQQYFLHLAIKMTAMKSKLRSRVDDLSVDVELKLLTRGVSNAYRCDP